MKYQSFEEFCTYIAVRNPGQPEYMQAVAEVMESLWPFIAQHPKICRAWSSGSPDGAGAGNHFQGRVGGRPRRGECQPWLPDPA